MNNLRLKIELRREKIVGKSSALVFLLHFRLYFRSSQSIKSDACFLLRLFDCFFYGAPTAV